MAKKNKLDLASRGVTLLGVDGVTIERLIWAADYCQALCNFAQVKLLTHLPSSDPRVVFIPPLLTLEAYSKFIMKQLANWIESDFVLVIQHDGYIQNAMAWTDEFLKYDYVGAPWYYDDAWNVGNGGFSLRSKKLQTLLRDDPVVAQTMPEDHQICRHYRPYLESKGIRFAPESVAAQFSLEGNFKYGFCWNGQFGFHGFQNTLGVRSSLPLQRVDLIQVLNESVRQLQRSNPATFVQFQLESPLAAAIIETNLQWFLIFLRIHVFSSLMKVKIPGPVQIQMKLTERPQDIYFLEVYQKEPFPGGLWLRAKYASKPEYVGGKIFEVAIPKFITASGLASNGLLDKSEGIIEGQRAL